MDTDNTANGEAKTPAPKTRKVKKQVRKGDLPLSAGTASLDQAAKDTFTEKEGQMIAEDKLVADTEDKKNELESEIYGMRNKLDEPYASSGYAEFASEDEKSVVKAKCEELEVSSVVRTCWYDLPLIVDFRTGSTKTAKTQPKASTSPRWTSSVHPPALSSRGSTTRGRRRRTRGERLLRRSLPRSGRRKRPRGKRKRRRRRLLRRLRSRRPRSRRMLR